MSESTAADAERYPLGEAVVRLRWLLVVLSLVFAVASGWGLGRLTFNPDSRVFFASDNPDRLALDALEEIYTRNDAVTLVVAPHDGNVFSQQNLAFVEDLTERTWQLPHARRVDSVTNFQYTHADGDDLIVGDLVRDGARLDDRAVERIREIALSDPELVNLTIAPRGDVTGVFVTLALPGHSNDETVETSMAARELIETMTEDRPDVDIYLTGAAVADMAFAEASERDTLTLVPAVVVLMFLIIGWSLRSVMGTGVTVLVIVMSVTTALGLTGWSGTPLNSVTGATHVVIMTLSVANCVHVLTTFRQFVRRGLHRHQAVVEALRVDLQPITVTSLTTAIGFLSLNFSASPPIGELGNIVAVGMAASLLYTVCWLAPVIAILPARGRSKGVPLVTLMDRLGDFVVVRRTPLLIGMSVLIVAAVSGIPRLELDDNFIRYFDESYDFRISSDFADERLTGMDTLEFSIPAGEEQGIMRPDYLSTLEAFAEWFRAQPDVTHVVTLSDTIKRLNRNLHGDDPAYYRIPENRQLSAQYLLLYELSLPYGLDLNSQINISKSQSRFTVMARNLSAEQLLMLAAKGEDWLRRNAPEMLARATGISVVFARLTARNIRSMLRGTLLSLVLISGLLLVVLRSVRIGILSLVPNLFPAAMAFGIWGYWFGQVNLVVSIMAAITLGIVVDDTVHFLTKYLQGRRSAGLDPQGAVRFAFSHVGKALWVTSFALTAGFLVLATSGFAVNGTTGLMCALTLSVALLADFFFLPPLLMLLDRDRRPRRG